MVAQEKLRVLFFLRRIGPYHHARFTEANKKLDLVAVETRPLSEEYPWNFKPGDDYGIERLPPSADKETALPGKLLKSEIRRLFEAHRPDVVVTTGWADPEYHAVVLEALRWRVPRVVISDTLYETEPRKIHRELVKRLVLRAYSSAIVAGTASRSYLRRLNFKDSAIFAPWDVVDNNFFARAVAQLESSHDEKFFLCISRFIPEKNLPGLIEAYDRYSRKGGTRRLVLAGSGPLEGEVRTQIHDLGIGNKVQLAGFVSYNALPRYMSGALCLILPSVSDTWGLVVNEAMAFGLPVLVSQNCGCAVDLVRDKENGCIFDPFRVDDIADKMLFMSEISEAEWKEMGKASRTIIASWDLKDFSEALYNACRYAIFHPAKQAVKWVHMALSR